MDDDTPTAKHPDQIVSEANVVALVEALAARGYDAKLDGWDDEQHGTVTLGEHKYLSIEVTTYSEVDIDMVRTSAEDAAIRSSHSRTIARVKVGDEAQGIEQTVEKIVAEVGPPMTRLDQPTPTPPATDVERPGVSL